MNVYREMLCAADAWHVGGRYCLLKKERFCVHKLSCLDGSLQQHSHAVTTLDMLARHVSTLQLGLQSQPNAEAGPERARLVSSNDVLIYTPTCLVEHLTIPKHDKST